MSYQRDREDFIARMTREGLPIDVTRLLLREATGLNRRAELACSSEAADRDRVPCPGSKSHDPNDCICDAQPSRESDDYPADHQDVTRIAVKDWQSERRIARSLPEGWTLQTAGDPRGYTLRVVPPSYAERNKGRDRFNIDAIGVPSGPSGLRF